MSDTSEMMLDGTLCQVCGVYLEDEDTYDIGGCSNGYPIHCKSCDPDPPPKGYAHNCVIAGEYYK